MPQARAACEQIGGLQRVLEAVPTTPLVRFDELDVKLRELGARRAEHTQQLAALEAPARRFGRVRDPDADERTFLHSAVKVDETAINDLRAERARLQAELGDPDQVRSEKDGIENALSALQRDHDAVRAALCERTIKQRPGWLVDALGNALNAFGTVRCGITPRARSQASGSITTSVTRARRSGATRPIVVSTTMNGVRPAQRSSGRNASSAEPQPRASGGTTWGLADPTSGGAIRQAWHCFDDG